MLTGYPETTDHTSAVVSPPERKKKNYFLSAFSAGYCRKLLQISRAYILQAGEIPRGPVRRVRCSLAPIYPRKKLSFAEVYIAP